jgi:hypothetical protein
MVESQPSKLLVASSILVSRSIIFDRIDGSAFRRVPLVFDCTIVCLRKVRIGLA